MTRAGLLSVLLFVAAACSDPAKGSVAPKADLSYDKALAALTEGNERYAQGKSAHADSGVERMKELADKGQHPFAAVLGCADSRVPPEEVFDRGLGDIFTVRVAGAVADVDEIGSLEYAVEHLKTPLVVVLGHTKCGAVTAVVKEEHAGGSIPQLVDNIVPAVQAVKRDHPDAKGEELVGMAVEANVLQSIYDLFRKSSVIREEVAAHKLKVVGAVYDIAAGKVKWLGEHPWQAEFLKAGEKEH